jgi:hypothetical protein
VNQNNERKESCFHGTLLSGTAALLGANVRFNSSMLVCISAKSFGLFARSSEHNSPEPLQQAIITFDTRPKKEEQRRLEILAGHWDVPVTDVDLEK